MNKAIDIICVIGWGISVGFGIIAALGLIHISPLAYICACLSCCSHHALRLVENKEKKLNA